MTTSIQSQPRGKFLWTLVRLLPSRLAFRFGLHTSALYWKLMHYWKRVHLLALTVVLAFSGWIQFQKESVEVLWDIMKTIVSQVLLAAAIVALMEILNPLTNSYSNNLAISYSSYFELVSSLLQLSGIFIGLYFTAISVVATTASADAAADVRALLIREKVGSRYFRIVALLGGVSLLLLGMQIFGYKPGTLNLLAVIFLGVLAIFSFVALATRTINFLDPARLVRYLAREVVGAINSVGPSGFLWKDQAVQNLYQVKAESALASYQNVVDLAALKSQSSLVELALPGLAVLRSYANTKPHIPSDSYWFKGSYEYQDWLAADFTRLNIALQTSTALLPNVVPDSLWFEQYVGKILASIFELRFKRRQEIQLLAEAVNSVLDTQANNFAINEAIQLVHTLYPMVHKKINVSDFDEGVDLLDAYGRWPISVLLGVSKAFSTISVESIHDILLDESSMYATEVKMPRAVIEELELANRKTKSEEMIEGRRITSSWFVDQLVAGAFVRDIGQAMESIASEIETAFTVESDSLIAEKKFHYAVHIIQRGLEACEKFDFHSREARECCERLLSLRRIADLPWPKIDWGSIGKTMEVTRERLVITLARAVNEIALLPQSQRRPDYFGQAYTLLAEYSYAAMATGNETFFQEIFPSFFSSCLFALERYRSQVRSMNDTRNLVLSTEPIIDLLELSGYAILYTALGVGRFWQIARRLWDDFLSKDHSRIVTISSIIAYRDSLFGVSSRDIVRTKWLQAFEQQLRNMGMIAEFGYSAVSQKTHMSPIIRAITLGGSILHYPRDVFLALYLIKKPIPSKVSWPRTALLFAGSLRRITLRAQKKGTRK